MIRKALAIWLLASLAHAEPLDLRTYADALGNETEALVRAIRLVDEIDLGEGEWSFGELPREDAEFAAAASEVTLLGCNRAWVWQHWEENRVAPKTLVRLAIPPGSVWWDQQPRSPLAAGPVVVQGIAFEHPGCTVFSFGDFAQQTDGRGADARGNSIRYCSFHGPQFDRVFTVRGVRQANFEIDHCSFRGGSGIDLHADMPSVQHVRMGFHNIAIRAFPVGGYMPPPGTWSDIMVEGVSGTGIAMIGQRLHGVSVEVGYAFEERGLNSDRLPGRVVRWDDEHLACLTETGWVGDNDKNRPEFVEGDGELVHRVPAFIGGDRCSVSQCRFEVNHSGLHMPQFVVAPFSGPLEISGTPELYGIGRERTNLPVVSAWCEGRQHKLFAQVKTSHLLLDHPLVNTNHPHDPNWGAHATAANNESLAPYRRRDGRWVYRLSDFPRGWTRRQGGPVTVWAGDPAEDGLRTLYYPGGIIVLRPGWTTTGDLPAGKLSGRGIEVAL